jgi:glutaminyl-tRNA synthetase
LRCSYDPDTLDKQPEGRKVRGVIHWVSARHALDGEVRLYDRLFHSAEPEKVAEGDDFMVNLNPDSLTVLSDCKLEPSLSAAKAEDRYQFERLGYFCADRNDHTEERPVFNRTVSLRDSWAKIQQAGRRS